MTPSTCVMLPLGLPDSPCSGLSPTPIWSWAVDHDVLVWMNTHKTPFLDHFFMTITWAGSLAVLLPLCLALLGWLIVRQQSTGVWLLIAGFGGAVLITHLAKIGFGRPRPDRFPPLINMPADLSFPSAHTAQIAAFSLCLVIMVWRSQSADLVWAVAPIALLLTGAVGYSRLYLQVHFLSDVIAGALLGMVWVMVVEVVLRWTDRWP